MRATDTALDDMGSECYALEEIMGLSCLVRATDTDAIGSDAYALQDIMGVYGLVRDME